MPGSMGEHMLQLQFGTVPRARGFYEHQVLDHVNDHMQAFLGRMEMAFIATADASGEADCSFRAGPPGFVCVLDERTLVYPEYRGNGVMASLGNIVENGHIGLLFIDFTGDAIGLHVNGRASVVESTELLMQRTVPDSVISAMLAEKGRQPERWVMVDVVEAYIHCSKHIPAMVKRSDVEPAWGTDDVKRKGGDYFKAKHAPRPWVAGPATTAPARPELPAQTPASPAPPAPPVPAAVVPVPAAPVDAAPVGS
jgi:predicted pyridoxine 5'-phosphate oxidase superfamily flavin-nucleotide-binding protein